MDETDDLIEQLLTRVGAIFEDHIEIALCRDERTISERIKALRLAANKALALVDAANVIAG